MLLILKKGGGKLEWAYINILGMATYFSDFSTRDCDLKTQDKDTN